MEKDYSTREEIEKAGFNPDFTPHKLRHPYAFLLAEGGAALESIQDRFGHGDDEITRLIYLHVTDPLKKEAAQRFGNLMCGLR
ncbi:hypothetical protein B9G55_19015 [Saccharibacillus sp. O16]|nr:hypothetical protein B9G55_19015 [Saccharibacillus sp. O16]